MRGSKKLASILLLVLVVGGWVFCLFGIMDGSEKADETTVRYNQCIERAEDYMKRGLYQKAIAEYTAAVNAKDKEKDWTSLLAAYQARYEEDNSIENDYIAAAKKAANAYNKHADYYVKLTELCISSDDYTTAFRYLSRALNAGVEDKKIHELYQKVRYATSLGSTAYSECSPLCNDNCVAVYNGNYGLLNSAGKITVKFQYRMLGGLGEENIYVFSDNDMSGLMDTDGVLQGKLDFTPTGAGVYSEGLVAVKNASDWGYYNSLGDYQFGHYSEAGAFCDGIAAVKEGAAWQLIDTSGAPVSEQYEEIRLNPDGSYLSNGVMLAKRKGKWNLYNKKQKKIGDFSCDNIDIVTDDKRIAFEQDGKWGFVNLDGEVLLKPAYENAKSFSNGFAAVCKDGEWGFLASDYTLAMDYNWVDTGYFSADGNCFVKVTSDTWQLLSRKVNE